MLCTCSAQTYNILLIDKPFQVVYCCQSGTTFTYPCDCKLIRPTNKVCLCGVKSNYYYNCELNILVDSIQMAILILERVKWALVVMWQSRIEIEHYYTSVSISSLVAVTDRNRTLFCLSHKWVSCSNQGLGTSPTSLVVWWLQTLVKHQWWEWFFT